MNAKELEDVIRTAAVIRTARKLRGKTQTEVANYLGVSQSFLSKLEHARLIPSSSQWFLFCKLTQINPAKTFDSGFIDHCFSIAKPYPESVFKLGSRYSEDQASQVRSIRPFINYFVSQLGDTQFERYCEERDVDPDYFRVLDHQTNIAFTLDLLTTLIKKGILTPQDISKITQPVSEPFLHGVLHEDYDRIRSSTDLIECFIRNQEKYETNFDYQIEDKADHSLILSVKPNSILKNFNYKDAVLGDFLCKYKQSYLKHFSAYGGHSQPAQLEEKQCHYHGHDKCIYEVKFAA
jgi:transcriptional regulator with XRE-family HTH domain